MKLPDEIFVSDISMTFYQPSDSCDDNDCGQTLEVFTQDAGGGKYLVIKTERWAIDNRQNILDILALFDQYMVDDK